MKVEDAIKAFKTGRNLALALDINEANVSRWKKKDGIVPVKHAMKLLNMTDGELDLCVRDYK